MNTVLSRSEDWKINFTVFSILFFIHVLYNRFPAKIKDGIPSNFELFSNCMRMNNSLCNNTGRIENAVSVSVFTYCHKKTDQERRLAQFC